MELIHDKNSRSGVIGTILVHLLLLLLFIQFGMPYQDPPPENEGAMLIDFGNSGGGDSSEEEPTEEENSSSASSESQNNSSQESAVTQNTTQTVDLNASQSNNTTTEPEVSENLNNALNALNNSNNNSKSSNSSSNNNSNNNSTGTNIGPSNGIGFSLIGRGKVSFKKPVNFDDDGKVVVDIVVDKYGKVVKATPGARGSTTTNPVLYKKAKEAALEAKFTKKLDAPSDQKGTMTFVFVLN